MSIDHKFVKLTADVVTIFRKIGDHVGRTRGQGLASDFMLCPPQNRMLQTRTSRHRLRRLPSCHSQCLAFQECAQIPSTTSANSKGCFGPQFPRRCRCYGVNVRTCDEIKYSNLGYSVERPTTFLPLSGSNTGEDHFCCPFFAFRSPEVFMHQIRLGTFLSTPQNVGCWVTSCRLACNLKAQQPWNNSSSASRSSPSDSCGRHFYCVCVCTMFSVVLDTTTGTPHHLTSGARGLPMGISWVARRVTSTHI